MNLIFSIYTPYDYPTMIIDGIIKNKKDDTYYYFPSNLIVYHFRDQETNCKITLIDEHLHPKLIELIWYSFVEKQVYYLEIDSELLNREQKNKINSDYAIGLAPYGDIAIWEINYGKSKLLSWLPSEAKEYIEDDKEMVENNALQYYLKSNKQLDSLIIPPRSLFDKYMQQFTYRYLSLFEHWDKEQKEWQKYGGEEIVPEFDYIEEVLFDGTHDKLHDGGLMNYHQAGKPKKLAVKWHIKKSEFTAYFWFEDKEIRTVFDRFYGAHPETKTDFMIRIDAEKNKYELALYRYGLKEPYVISESAYQLIVFKNKFERYRSENYNQPRGAWIW